MNRLPKWAQALLVVVLVVGVVRIASRGSRHSESGSWKLPPGKRPPAVALGANHGVILAGDGSLWTWGETAFGWQVLGLGNTIRTQAWLRRIGQEKEWVDVAAGGSTTLALKADGTMWGWGENLYGQLGDGSTVRERATPVRSLPGTDWKQVAVAGPHCVALKRDGSLWSWGNNWAGQLGDGTTNHSRVAVRVGSGTNWVRIWANLIQNVGQQTDGTLWFWGWDYSRSQPGSSLPLPARVSPDTNWVGVGMGDYMTFGIKSDGTLWAWGRLARVFTGATNAGADAFPVRVGTGCDWRACAAFSQACPVFLKRDGSLWVLDGSDQQDGRGVAPVTGLLSGLVTNNQLTCKASFDTLGCDPAFGVVKSLQITFRLGETNQTLTFREGSPVSLGGTGQPLTILRAIYGDPKLFKDPGRPLLPGPSYPPAQLREIKLAKGVVAFGGGRHKLGVAITPDGEVWTWGEALGQHTPPIPVLQTLAQLFNRFGVGVQWGEPGPVFQKEPTRLEIGETGSSSP